MCRSAAHVIIQNSTDKGGSDGLN